MEVHLTRDLVCFLVLITILCTYRLILLVLPVQHDSHEDVEKDKTEVLPIESLQDCKSIIVNRVDCLHVGSYFALQGQELDEQEGEKDEDDT